jgi:GT2 family glycosyltransferase
MPRPPLSGDQQEGLPGMDLRTLSIVIPTYNGLDHLKRLLPTVRRHAPPFTQTIIVDDASTDGTRRWLRRQHPWVELIALAANTGFCGAVNAGVARAKGEVVELLNNDTEVCPGWAEAALAHFADPAVGSVAPLVLFLDQPEVIESAGQEYHLCGWGKNRGYGQKLQSPFLVPQEVFGPSGSSGFYRRSALCRTGTMLPEYGAYYEDVDLSFRLRWAGYRCQYEPASRVLHKESASYSRQRERVAWLLARNEELVYWINLRSEDLLLGIIPHLGFLAVRALRQTWQGQAKVFFSAKWDALRRWHWVIERRRELWKLALQAGGTVPVDVSRDAQILQEGWNWMIRRKSA